MPRGSSRKWITVPQSRVFEYVAAQAARSGFIERVILFGSRARGQERTFSDYDLGVELTPGTSQITWLAFAERLDDEAPTLCQLSLVQLKPSIRSELSRIEAEGAVIYER